MTVIYKKRIHGPKISSICKANNTIMSWCKDHNPMILSKTEMINLNFDGISCYPNQEELASYLVFVFCDKASSKIINVAVQAKKIRKLMSKQFSGYLNFRLELIKPSESETSKAFWENVEFGVYGGF